MAAPQRSDESLLHAVAQRDVAALDALYGRHAQTVYNVILRIVRESAIADEVLQDTFWQVWQKADEFRGSGSAAAWLHRIARNKSLDHLRRQRSRPQPITASSNPEGDDPLASLVAPGGSVEQITERTWRWQSVRQALRDIPDEQRECLELAYFDGLTQREIAEQMATPVGTVKTRMRIGLEKLERILRAAGLGTEDVA